MRRIKDTSLMLISGTAKSTQGDRRFSRILFQVAPLLGVALLAIGTICLLLLIALRIPHWYSLLNSLPELKDRLSLENEMLKSLGSIVGGAFLVVGVYFTWRNTFLTKEGQITDRFNSAINHMGDEKPEIRLGGIYALARIAKDSPKDHWSVVQILCAFVRTRSANRDPGSNLPADVQAVLTETSEQSLDLTGVDLRNADLKGARFDRVRFDDANLQSVDFMRASLIGADFRGAKLQKAHLREARLIGANFVSANLEGASLRLANLRNSNLLGAQFRGATLIGADLTDARYVVRGQLEAGISDGSTRLPKLMEASQD